jgi:C-terminal processing protease CtpA/Prc
VPGLPADRAGLAVDDALLRIDGVDCAGVPLTELWPRLWLQDRDRVRLVVLREGQTIDVELP